MSTLFTKIRPIHPFAARMAPSIVWRRLNTTATRSLRVLDPMSGSGTTIVASRLRGHHAVGFDTDPLAILIARAWASNANPKRLRERANQVLSTALVRYQNLNVGDAYPAGADAETRSFLRFWFDTTNRRQLAALASAISAMSSTNERNLLWCAFSRLIIT